MRMKSNTMQLLYSLLQRFAELISYSFNFFAIREPKQQACKASCYSNKKQ